MGRSISYKIDDYADRIMLYMSISLDPIPTDKILKEVKGTDYRLVEGLIKLALDNKVRVYMKKERLYWSVKLNEDKD